MVTIALLVAAAFALLGIVALARVPSYRGDRVVICPETKEPVGATIDAWLAARTELGAAPRFVISTCSRWPEHAGCDQACAPQVADSPQGTLVRNIVARWYRSRSCVFCGESIREIHGLAIPALRTIDGQLRDWTAIEPADLTRMLKEAVAVCARCDVVESFRRDFPKLVIERPAPPREAHPVLRSDAVY